MSPQQRKRGGKPKLFQCTGFGDCRMVFTRSEHLARHTRKHTGERPFKCIVPECSRMFSRFDNMMQHTQTHRLKAETPLPHLRKRPDLSVKPVAYTGQSGLVSPVSLPDDDDMNERRLSVADLCNPQDNEKHPSIHLTHDEFEALQALGSFQRAHVYYDSLRDLASTACIEPSADRRGLMSP